MNMKYLNNRLMRSLMKMLPLTSKNPMSPVCSQPSTSMSDLVGCRITLKYFVYH